MTVAEYFQLSFSTVILLSCLGFWILIRKYKKTQNSEDSEWEAEMEKYVVVNNWKSVQLLIALVKWSWKDNASKRSLLDEFCFQMNQISTLPRPKLFRILNFNIVVNENFTSAANVVNSKTDANRFPDAINELLTNGKTSRGIIWNGGPIWKELRKYTLKKLGQLGFGKTDYLSRIISDLLPDLLNHLENVKWKSGNKIPIQNLFALYVINVVWCTVGGKKYVEDDEAFVTLSSNLRMLSSIPTWKAYLASFLPKNSFFNNLFGFGDALERVNYLREYFMAFMDEEIKNSKEKLEPENFVDYFLLEIEKHKDNEEMNKIYNKEQLAHVVGEFFIAGLDTTSKYLELFLMYMILNPEVQRKVQEEIDFVLPGSIIPSYSDHRSSMPYMCATMMEVHRMGPITPLVARYIPNFLNRLGKVQEGAQIVNVMWAVSYDVSYWGDPYKFRPERFLNAEKAFITERMNRVMPFGAGSRMCPGESVATSSTFAFLVAILKKYRVSKGIEDEVLEIEKNCGSVTQPNSFHMALAERLPYL